MGSVFGDIFEWITDPVGSIIRTVIGDDAFDIFSIGLAISGLITGATIEPVMHFLGFNDEIMYYHNMSVCPIFDKKLYKRTQLDLVTRYMKEEPFDAIAYAREFSSVGDKQFGKYYRHGKWYYSDYLPSCSVFATIIDRDEIINILKEKVQSDIYIADIIAMVPFDEDWVKWNLQENYNYNVSDGYLILNNKYYYLDSFVYNKVDDTFLSTLKPIPELRIVTDEVIEASVNKLETYDEQIEKVYNQVLTYRTDTGVLINSDSQLISTTSIPVESGTGVEYTISNNISDVLMPVTDSDLEITFPSTENKRMYVVTYSSKSTGQFYYWIYDPTTNTYPSIKNPVSKSTPIELFPIVLLRESNRNISKGSSRYKSTKDLLNAIGIDVDSLIDGYSSNDNISSVMSAFFLLGVVPSDSGKVVSKVLYEMFDFLYDTLPTSSVLTALSAGFKEGTYNLALAWTARTTELKNEKIGSIGTYTHVIRNRTYSTIVYEEYIVSNAGISARKVVVNKITEIKVDSTVIHSSSEFDRSFVIHKSDVYTRYVRYNDDGVPEYVDSLPDDSSGDYSAVEVPAFEMYPLGRTTKVIDSSSDSDYELAMTKQITSTQTKTLYCFAMHGVVLVRGEENGAIELDAVDSRLLIPLPVEVVARLTLMQKTDLLGHCAYLMFTSEEAQHLKWYETEAFASFLQVLSIGITVVVSIFSFGWGGVATMTATQALMAALRTVAIAVAVQLALYLVNTYVQDIGLKIALSMAVAVAGMWAGGAFSNFDIGSALQLVSLPVMAVDMYTNDIQAQMQNNLMQDIKSFSSEYDKRASTNQSIIEGFNSGLTTESAVGLAVGLPQSSTETLFSPSQFYSMATTAYLDFDMMYSGLYDVLVHDFVKNRKHVGMITNEGDE